MIRIKKGFTLIELLAVIVILAIIAVIVTPVITGMINESKKNAFKESVNGLIDGAKYYSLKTIIEEEKIFAISNKNFNGDGFDMKGSLPETATIIINNQAQISIKSVEDKWCAYKEYEDSVVIVTEDLNMCDVYIEEPIPDLPVAPDTCFVFNETTHTITGYYNNENNNSSNPACPKEFRIPEEINNVDVYKIGSNAFKTKNLIKVIIPSSVNTIESWAFENNQITNVYLLYGLETIGSSAFSGNKLKKVMIPSSVYSIQANSFSNQTTVYEELIIKHNDAADKKRFDSLLSQNYWLDATVRYVYEEPIVTSSRCFEFDSSTGTIGNYYNY